MNCKPCIVLPFTIMFLFLSGCGDEKIPVIKNVVLEPGPHEAIQAELDENRRKWRSKSVTDYQYVFRRTCECHRLAAASVTVTITNSMVESVLVFRTEQKFLDGFVDGEQIPQGLHSEFVEHGLLSPHRDPPTLENKDDVWSIATDLDDVTYIFRAEGGQLAIYLDASSLRFSSYHTIEDLFDLVQDAIDGKTFEGRPAYHIRMAYDSEFGYPTEALIDYSQLMADEETIFSVKDFVVLEF